MKRFHVHLNVKDLPASVRFYSSLFGAPPTVRHDDYAKWMLDDPRLNFAISTRGSEAGLNHLGFQADSDEELRGLRDQFGAADAGVVQQDGQACCYARSDKYWVTDPTGVAWESFHTLESIPMFSEQVRGASETSACCVPVREISIRRKPLPDTRTSDATARCKD